MKKSNIILLTFFWVIFGCTPNLLAQNQYDIRLRSMDITLPNSLCYEVQLASASQTNLNLAGQNYRLFYDAEYFKFNKQLSKSLLPIEQYTDLIVKDDLRNIDASGTGVLPFESHLGFLNFGNDLANAAQKAIILPASGAWVSTATLCFDIINPAAMSNPHSSMEIVWAREELTADLATAYVEVAEWIAPYKTMPAIASSYEETSFSTALADNLKQQDITIFPNPTKGKASIKFDITEGFKLTVYSITGAVTLADFLAKGTTTYQLDLTPFPAGLYLIEVTNGAKTYREKIEKID